MHTLGQRQALVRQAAVGRFSYIKRVWYITLCRGKVNCRGRLRRSVNEPHDAVFREDDQGQDYRIGSRDILRDERRVQVRGIQIGR